MNESEPPLKTVLIWCCPLYEPNTSNYGHGASHLLRLSITVDRSAIQVEVIAVAGGSGGLGETIIEALNEDKRYKAIVLSRKASNSLISGVDTIVVDYSDIDVLVDHLRTNETKTVILVIQVNDQESAAAEHNLVTAASKSACTTHFIASNWGFPIPEDERLQLPSGMQKLRLQTVELLRTTDLQWTQINAGYFLDYFGMPHVETHISPLIYAVDIVHRVSATPGTGNEMISFTYTKDVAKFVVKALGLPPREENLFCHGETTTWNELVATAEKITGSTFSRNYDEVQKLERGEVTGLPCYSSGGFVNFPKQFLLPFLAGVGLQQVWGLLDLSGFETLNQIFPEVQTTTVRHMLSLWSVKTT